MISAKLNKKDLIYSELCYKVMGALFDVWKEIGFGHKEGFYQKATAVAFEARKLFFEKELPVKIKYRNSFIGIYYFDFLIENKIVLEIKVRNYFSKKDID